MLKRIKKYLAFFDELVFGISMICLVCLTITMVFFRFILNNPIAWGEEIQMFLVVWAVFFGSSIAIREKGHIAVDIIFDALSPTNKKRFSVIIWLLVAASIVAITYLEIERVGLLIQSDLRTPVLRIPSSLEYIGVILACLLMLINHIVVGIESLRNERII